MAPGASGNCDKWQASRRARGRRRRRAEVRALDARGRRRRRPEPRGARRWRPGPTLGSGLRSAGRRAGGGAGGHAGRVRTAGLRTWATWNRAVRLSRKKKSRAYCGHFKFKAWAVLRADGGVCESGAFRVAEGSPSRDHHLAAARAWRDRAVPVPAPWARGPGGAPECRHAWAARVRGAAARTPGSKLPGDHPGGRPGPPRGRPRPRGVHRSSPRPPCRRGCRRAPLCNVNFSGTNCLLIV